MIKYKQNILEKNLPYSLIRLGLACNANCSFCNVPPESYSSDNLSLNQAKREIFRLAKNNTSLRIDISGGEPTIRNDIFDIIRYASKLSISVIQLQTNCILLHNKDFAKQLKDAGLHKVFVALHSHIPRIHDRLVGVPGAFNKCIKGIKNSIAMNIEVTLNPVITTVNYKFLPGYIKFINKNFPKIKNLSLSVVQPRGRAWKNTYLIPRYRLISPHVREALLISKKLNLIVNNPYCGLPLCIGDWYKYVQRCSEYWGNLIKIRQGIKNANVSYDKVKGPQCASCDLNTFCNGVWKEYSLLYGFFDLKPIQKKGIQTTYDHKKKAQVSKY